MDSWEDEMSSSSSGSESELEKDRAGSTPVVGTPERTESAPSWTGDGGGQSLVKVYRVFQMVQHEFDGLFKKMWA